MSSGFEVDYAVVYKTFHTGIPILGDFKLTETLIVSWIVMIIITGLCIFLTRDLKVENISKRQAFAEMLVETGNNFVRNNTGTTRFDKLIPFVAALFATSVISNLISLTGLRSPTADLSTEAAWAIVVFIMITAAKAIPTTLPTRIGLIHSISFFLLLKISDTVEKNKIPSIKGHIQESP